MKITELFLYKKIMRHSLDITFYITLFNLWYRVGIFSMQIIIFLSTLESTFNILFFCLQYCEVPLRVPLTWSFSQVFLPLGQHHLFVTVFFLDILAVSLISIYLMILISLSIIWHLFATSSMLLSHSLFQLPIFIKCHRALSLWDKKTQPNALLSASELYNTCAVTNHWQRMWLTIDCDVHDPSVEICLLKS